MIKSKTYRKSPLNFLDFFSGHESQRNPIPASHRHPAAVRLPPGASSAYAGKGAAQPVSSLLPLARLGARHHVHQDQRGAHLHGAGLVDEAGH